MKTFVMNLNTFEQFSSRVTCDWRDGFNDCRMAFEFNALEGPGAYYEGGGEYLDCFCPEGFDSCGMGAELERQLSDCRHDFDYKLPVFSSG